MRGKGKSMKKNKYIDYEDGTRVMLDDDDVPELTAADFKKMVPFNKLPASLQKKLAAIQKRGRPRSPVRKQMIAFRFAPDLLAAIKASGRGYNARVERVLRDAVETGKL